ncbi:MAG: hypothetical protein OHK0039_48690 [Bacteroidia bacterium]
MLTVALAAWSLTALYAQPARSDDARAQARAYVQEEVLPVVQAQRARLDAHLSADEQTQLADIRSELKALRDNRPDRGTFGPGHPPTEAQRAAFRSQRDQHIALMDQVEDLATAHAGEIQTLLDELQPQAEAWRAHLASLRPAGAPADSLRGRHEGRPDPGMGAMHHGGHHRGGHHPGGAHMRFLSPQGFLLLDPAAGGDMGLQLAPNPARTTQQVRFDLPQAGKVSLRILDTNGQVVKTLFTDSYREAGTHTATVATADLRPGIYFYQIDGPTGTQTTKLIVE